MDFLLTLLGCIGLGMALQSLGKHDQRESERQRVREEWEAYFRGEYEDKIGGPFAFLDDLDDDSGE